MSPALIPTPPSCFPWLPLQGGLELEDEDDEEAERVWAMLQERSLQEAAQMDEQVQLQRLREINAMLDVNEQDDDDGLLDASEHAISYEHLTFDVAIAEVNAPPFLARHSRSVYVREEAVFIGLHITSPCFRALSGGCSRENIWEWMSPSRTCS